MQLLKITVVELYTVNINVGILVMIYELYIFIYGW